MSFLDATKTSVHSGNNALVQFLNLRLGDCKKKKLQQHREVGFHPHIKSLTSSAPCHIHTHCPSTSICINVIQSTFPGPPIVLHSVGSEFRPPSRLDLGSCDGYRFSAKIWQQYSLISYRLAGLSNISSISFPCNQS